MKYKTYRLCLLSLLIIAVIGGIFYYLNHGDKEVQEVDGTFVEKVVDCGDLMRGYFEERLKHPMYQTEKMARGDGQ